MPVVNPSKERPPRNPGIFRPPPALNYCECAFVKAWDKQWSETPDGAAVSEAMDAWIAHLAEENPGKDTTNLREVARCAISRHAELGTTGYTFVFDLRALFRSMGFE